MDKSNIEKLMLHQSDRLAECENALRQWRRYSADYGALRRRLSTLPEHIEQPVVVPLGALALQPGRLVRTNELLLLLGDNWFCKTSVHHAIAIVDRRLAHCSEMTAKAECQLQMVQRWLKQTHNTAEPAEGASEICEPLDEEHERQWKESRRQRVARERRLLNQQRLSAESDHQRLMARLDQLALTEATDTDSECSDADECAEVGGAAGGAAVVSQCCLDSDDSSQGCSEDCTEVWQLAADGRGGVAVPDAAARPALSAARKRVTFSERVSVCDQSGTDSGAAPPAPSIPATDGARGPSGAPRADSVPPEQLRPQLSEVFTYKIVERRLDGSGSTDCQLSPPADRPVSMFRASRSHTAL